ncbi:hypothetical protein [Streptomyces sp. NBC_00258]|uniref:hypothetical protein n=1 Tax=Streptomyces sp. NBC_00258 TaxID=2903642 RepID=UPI002E281A70|nr:hypothetical protein [Streptomyces sp. NBC_00258]
MTGNPLVVLHGRLWINPSGDAHALQCVARTTKGSRCQNPVEYGQVFGFHEFQLGSAGYAEAYGPGVGAIADRWLAQHCTLHDTPDVIDCETTELHRFDIVRDAPHVRAHRVDASYDGEPADCPKAASTTGSEDKTTASIVTILEAAARLRPSAGYVNGHDYQDWYTKATPNLLLALAQLARIHHGHELAGRLEQLSKPLCMEPLDAVLSYDAHPQTWCGRPVKSKSLPCELHTPERAADIGRCTWADPGAKRICRSAPLKDDDRCENHATYCRAVKSDGTVCNRHHCRVPKHRQASTSDAAAGLAVAQQ